MALAFNGERFKEMDVDAVLYPAIHQGRAKIVVAVKDYLIRTVYLGLQLEGTKRTNTSPQRLSIIRRQIERCVQDGMFITGKGPPVLLDDIGK